MPLDSLCCENFWVPVEEVPTSTCGFLKSGSIFSFFFFLKKKSISHVIIELMLSFIQCRVDV
jgi:hypothetical protein